MKVSFDGLRINLAESFNEMVRTLNGTDLRQSQMDSIENLRGMIGGLLCIYDGENITDLSDKVKLSHISKQYEDEE